MPHLENEKVAFLERVSEHRPVGLVRREVAAFEVAAGRVGKHHVHGDQRAAIEMLLCRQQGTAHHHTCACQSSHSGRSHS